MTRTMYTFLIYLSLPLIPLKLLWRSRKQPEYLAYWKERFGIYTTTTHKPVIWLHCVSVGETHAASPLVKLLQNELPDHQILLTHTTPTGRQASEQLFGDTVKRVYLPYDAPFAVEKFLDHFKPILGVLMETELWFNLIHQCREKRVPLMLLNARLSDRSARGYAKLGNLTKQGLRNLATIAAQTHEDAERFQGLGGRGIQIMGNLKFDVTAPDEALANGLKLRAKLNARERPVFVAASTRAQGAADEESLILEAVARANIPNLLTIIVPRHPQRFDTVEAMLVQSGYSYIRRSNMNKPVPSSKSSEPTKPNVTVISSPSKPIEFVLGDTMGEMFSYLAAGDVAFIGGSLLPLGGQNLIEAAAMGKPVLIGPHTYNFAQISSLAVDSGAAIRVKDVNDLAEALEALFANPVRLKNMSGAAYHFSSKNRGATQRCFDLMEPFIYRAKKLYKTPWLDEANEYR